MPSFVELSQQGVGARVPDRRALLALIAVAAVALAIALLPLSWAVLLVAGGIVFIVTLVRPQFG
ncbi:MAG: hypothetical protein PVJ85_07360, partial [Anaerolineae bacterium]